MPCFVSCNANAFLNSYTTFLSQVNLIPFQMYLNRRTEFMFIRNAIIIRAHIHTNLNIKIHIHLAEADSETLLHLRCNSLR